MFRGVTGFGLLMAALRFAVVPEALQAQITVTSNDILGQIGSSQTLVDDTTGSVTVNVGTAGAGRTWDFRSLTLAGTTISQQSVQPQGTPFFAQFPQANFVQKVIFSEFQEVENYIYFRVTGTSLSLVGVGSVFGDTTFVSPEDSEEIVPLPITFGQTWATSSSDTSGDPATFVSITHFNSNNTVDAWGTVRLQLGDVASLRIRTDDVTINQTWFGGTLLSSDTTTSISYSWISQDDFQLVTITSRDGETNPNFTDASSVTLLTSRTVAVAERGADAKLPTGYVLSQNFPNPFNPETAIRFEIPQTEMTELAIFNLAGEKVRTLISGVKPAGAYAVKWDGRDDRGLALASGAYLYRLEAGKVRMAKRLVLVK